ncbi:hypothetical protein [Tenacibaculum finnmarkense]|uniref:hypothetical protein n=1 Tax=Tenacibaculum finnmarkense TaxID=2781243 RepID=UPI001EFBCAF2|nr:hypothetical protein [Tenacibaculum finnmarkense]MCG8226380.1 hypothetical protein [Tenacibaculum finnmarkense genomovar finnmarkense]
MILFEIINLFAVDSFELLDTTLIEWLKAIRTDYLSRQDLFIGHARILSGLFCLIYFAGKIFETLSGDGQWQVLPLLKPFGIGLIIMNWATFILLISAPFAGMEDTVQDRLDEANKNVSENLTKRDKLHSEYGLKLISKADEIEAYQSNGDDKDAMSFLGFDMSSVSSKISGLGIIIMSKFRMLLENLIFWLGLIIFRLGLYLILVLEIFFKYILIILGPLAFAFSIIPQFKDSGSQWVARFISISFYPILARLMAVMSINMINYACKEDIGMLEKILASDDAFMAIQTSNGAQIGTTMIIAFLAGFICFVTIPSISEWIVQSSGAGKALGKLSRGASSAIGK